MSKRKMKKTRQDEIRREMDKQWGKRKYKNSIYAKYREVDQVKSESNNINYLFNKVVGFRTDNIELKLTMSSMTDIVDAISLLRVLKHNFIRDEEDIKP